MLLSTLCNKTYYKTPSATGKTGLEEDHIKIHHHQFIISFNNKLAKKTVKLKPSFPLYYCSYFLHHQHIATDKSQS
ncbi:hypothetical protein GYH30_046838 [Glycine max]|uniref:Uncharacterized protein n=1 Tax=Glycine max TaxID=3847 RepID=A0A0R0FJF3_SOYBN|nr:hypothetical protein GYH30_046838 [Glycine max]